MARVFTDGAEMGDLLFWDYSTGISVGSATPDPWDGEYYYESTGYSSCYKTITALTELYFRFRYRCESTDTRNSLPQFNNSGVYAVKIYTNALRQLCATISGGATTTSAQIINADQWYLIEVYVKIDDAPNGKITVKVDGTTVIDYTGDTKISTRTNIDAIEFILYSTSYIDDLALNDTTGGADNSWCGDGSIVKVYPDGNGTHNNWHGSDGNDVDNYALVDEYPHDSDTTYVYHDSSSSGTQDQYTMSDYTGTGYTITRIYAEARARLTAASANTLKLGVLPSGSVDQMSAGRPLPVGNYARVVGSEYTTNPADAGAWEEADIDAIEGVIEVG